MWISNGRSKLLAALDLADDAQARARAQEFADNAGRRIVVVDESGKQVCVARPARRNEITLYQPRN
jgi:hypothetical protein